MILPRSDWILVFDGQRKRQSRLSQRHLASSCWGCVFSYTGRNSCDCGGCQSHLFLGSKWPSLFWIEWRFVWGMGKTQKGRGSGRRTWRTDTTEDRDDKKNPGSSDFSSSNSASLSTLISASNSATEMTSSKFFKFLASRSCWCVTSEYDTTFVFGTAAPAPSSWGGTSPPV